MNPFSLMECNMKSPMQWDWDSLISFTASTAENDRQPADWEIDAGGGIDAVSLCSSGFGGGGVGSGSDSGHPTFSKSSKSTSISSSSAEVKTYKFTSETVEELPEDLCSTEEFAKQIGTSLTLGASFGSGEPVLGLKLGKRTYFEDVCPEGNNPKASTFTANLASSVAPVERSKTIRQGMQAPRCQVEGCNLDLSSAKDYHRKHRVCETHSKYPKVIVDGLERRFCQQCSRFHGLSEFDEKKRSCRRRLSDHNARRRKPQPDAVHLNQGMIYDGRQQLSFVGNRFELSHTRTKEKLLWDSPSGLELTQSKGLMLKPVKLDGFDGQMLLDGDRLPNLTTTQLGASKFLPAKTKFATAEALGKDMDEFTISFNLGGAQDSCCALSLLSTSTATSWGSCEPKHVSLDHSNNNLKPIMSSITQPFTLGSSDYWVTEQQLVAPATSHRDGESRFRCCR